MTALSGREPAPQCVVVLQGDVDVVSAPAVRSTLLPLCSPGAHLLVDVSGVGLVDSVGLGVLVAAQRRLRSTGGALVLQAPQERVLRVLRLAGLSDLLEPSLASVSPIAQARSRRAAPCRAPGARPV